MTDEQLKAMEASAPLLVAEVRQLLARIGEQDKLIANLMGQAVAIKKKLAEYDKLRSYLSAVISVGMGGSLP